MVVGTCCGRPSASTFRAAWVVSGLVATVVTQARAAQQHGRWSGSQQQRLLSDARLYALASREGKGRGERENQGAQGQKEKVRAQLVLLAGTKRTNTTCDNLFWVIRLRK